MHLDSFTEMKANDGHSSRDTSLLNVIKHLLVDEEVETELATSVVKVSLAIHLLVTYFS